MYEYNEELLIKKAKSGSDRAFEMIVRHYEKTVYNTIYYRIGDREEAYDLSQEVFIKVYRSLDNFRGDCKFSTWLYKICVNTSLDYIRRVAGKHNESLSIFEEADTYKGQVTVKDDDVQKDPEKFFEKQEIRKVVKEAIFSLTDEHREIVILRDILGLSYEEISEKTSLELGTVKSRINRARQKIKKYLIERNCL